MVSSGIELGMYGFKVDHPPSAGPRAHLPDNRSELWCICWLAGAVASEVVGTTVREVPGQTVVSQAAAPTIVGQPVMATVGQSGSSQANTSSGYSGTTTTGTTGAAPMGGNFRWGLKRAFFAMEGCCMQWVLCMAKA